MAKRDEFPGLGRRRPDTPKEAPEVLARPIPQERMSRTEPTARTAPLDDVCLPLRPSYCRLSPAGALIDAIAWLKPVVTTDLPVFAKAFGEDGEIGERSPMSPGRRTPSLP